jgi:hypothetical protein
MFSYSSKEISFYCSGLNLLLNTVPLYEGKKEECLRKLNGRTEHTSHLRLVERSLLVLFVTTARQLVRYVM